MSTQKYYKNRLGFDPREDGNEYSTPTKSPVRGGSHGFSDSDYGSPMKKSRQSTPSMAATPDTSQGAYEDALTQFKGNMSMWEYFVEAKDKEGMCRKLIKKRTSEPAVLCTSKTNETACMPFFKCFIFCDIF